MPDRTNDSQTDLIHVIGLKKYFPIRAGLLKRVVGNVRAVDDVSFFIKRGETLGLVGESGCGKTTVGKSIMMLVRPSAGYVFFGASQDVVDDFRMLYDFDRKARKDGLTKELSDQILSTIEQVFSLSACDIRSEKKKSFCSNAKKLMEAASGANQADSKAKNDAVVRQLLKESIKELAERYCINYISKRGVRKIRSRIQFVFQDPFSSLDPRMLIKDIVSEPLVAQRGLFKRQTQAKKGSEEKLPVTKEQILQETTMLLEKVGLNKEHLYRFPHEFSGGQRQRIGIARALSVKPDFIVLDEPTSALDVSVQAQILNMLNDLQHDFGLTYLFISHDLSTIRYMCDRIAVMYLGKIVEFAPKKQLYEHPTHPYTEALLSVIPVPDPEIRKDRIILTGDVPSPANPPSGCRFHTRCSLAIPICSKEEPPLTDRGMEHFVACHVRKEIVS